MDSIFGLPAFEDMSFPCDIDMFHEFGGELACGGHCMGYAPLLVAIVDGSESSAPGVGNCAVSTMTYAAFLMNNAASNDCDDDESSEPDFATSDSSLSDEYDNENSPSPALETISHYDGSHFQYTNVLSPCMTRLTRRQLTLKHLLRAPVFPLPLFPNHQLRPQIIFPPLP